MTLRHLVRQVLLNIRAVRRGQQAMSIALERLVAESIEQSRQMAEINQLLLEVAEEVRAPAPAGSVTITVGPVSEQPSTPAKAST